MIVLDSGVLIAAADRNDRWHAQAAAIIEGYPSDQLVLPAPVVPEASWMIGSHLDAHVEATFVASVAAGDFRLVDLLPADWSRAASLIEQYADLDLGVVDAAVVSIAERLQVTTVASINPRDFRVVRPLHCDAFELIP